MNDHYAYTSDAEMIASVDTIVTGIVTGWRDFVRPDPGSDGYSSIPATVFTVAVDEVLKARFPVGEEIEVRQTGRVEDGSLHAWPDEPALTVMTGKVLLFLSTWKEDLPSSVSNPAQGIYDVDADGELSAVTSYNSLRPGSLRQVAEEIAAQEADRV